MPTAQMGPAEERKDAAADASDTAAKIDAFLRLRGAPSPPPPPATSARGGRRGAPWREKFAKAALYVAEHYNVPAIGAANPEEKEILSWLASQHKNGLSEDQILHVEQLRVQIKDRTARVKWRNNFQSLKDYAESHGGKANFHRNTDNRGRGGIYSWAMDQRKSFKEGLLSNDRIARLKSIGFDFEWDSHQARSNEAWENMYTDLVDYHKVHGNCDVPWEYSPERHRSGLGQWVSLMKKNHAQNRLSDKKKAKLAKLDFDFRQLVQGKRHLDDQWEASLQEVIKHKSANDGKEPDSRSTVLSNWLSSQRHNYRKGMLEQWRLGKLKDAGIELCRASTVSDNATIQWDKRFSELIKYKTENIGQGPSGALATWVSAQRQKYRWGKLNQSRISKLDDAGISLVGRHQVEGERNFRQLILSFEDHGHWHVGKDSPKLKAWVGGLRKSDNLSKKDRERRQLITLVYGDWMKDSTEKWKKCSSKDCDKFALYNGCCHSHYSPPGSRGDDRIKDPISLLAQISNSNENAPDGCSQSKKLSDQDHGFQGIETSGENRSDKQVKVCSDITDQPWKQVVCNILDAIRAGRSMGKPNAATEVDFDFEDPPNTFREPTKLVTLAASSDKAEYDVAFPRKGHRQEFLDSPNTHFGKLLYDFRPYYIVTPQQKRRQIAKSLVFINQHRGGRFFLQEKEGGQFHELSDKDAIDRTVNTLGMGGNAQEIRAEALRLSIPNAAREVDFDFEDPPDTFRERTTLVTLAASSDLTEHDVVLPGKVDKKRMLKVLSTLRPSFVQLLGDFAPCYFIAHQHKKRQVAKVLVFINQHRGGRFFRQGKNNGQYHELNDKDAIDKIMFALGKRLTASEIIMEVQSRTAEKKLIDESKEEENLLDAGRMESLKSVLEESMPSRDSSSDNNEENSSLGCGDFGDSNNECTDCNIGKCSPSVKTPQEQINFTTEAMPQKQEFKYWEEQHRALQAYIQQHGHPPQKQEDNPHLYDWIQLQKTRQSHFDSLLDSC